MVQKLPIVYVRGFAGSTGGINKAVDDPFYGFNAGSTHVRTAGDGVPRFYQFESPLLRLVTDEHYRILVHGDQEAYLRSRPSARSLSDPGKRVPPESIWVYRFYDESATTFGRDEVVEFDIETAATGLYDFIDVIRDRTGVEKVYLVAHSMGGLVSRCMLQKVCQEEGRLPGPAIVDKFFTYATPHGGISFQTGNGLLDWAMEVFGPAGADIFAPDVMYGYLTAGAQWKQKPPEGWRANEMPREVFDPKRVFSLVGTDAKDYGIVEKVVGPKSDGLVMIDRAYVRDAHRAFVHRSHSGRYGIVNSEEGYQNLRRFLFATMQVNVGLAGLELPPAPEGTKEVWQADIRVSMRGLPVVMHEQQAAHHCPIQLTMETQRERDTADAPAPLTTVFLLDATRFHGDPLEERPPRCRYAMQLRVFRLREKNGFFFWQDHLEQIADWEDTLIVDAGRLEDDDEATVRAWAAWNSDIPTANAERDPIAADALEVGEGVVDIDLPAAAREVLGASSRIRLHLNPWN